MTSFRNLSQPTGRKINIDQTVYNFFGGTAYLGLLDNKEYIELYKQGIDRYGLNNGTSRTNNVQLGVYQEAEEYMAKRFGFADAVLLSSGYLAAQVAVQSLAADHKIYYALGAHPSLWLNDNPNITGSFSEWKAKTIQEINHSDEMDFVIISNAIDNLTPELFDFSDFKNIDSRKRITLILDDSHGIGVLRKNGVSVDLAAISSENISVIVLASLAKGMGTDAGIVLGSTNAIAKIRQHPIYMGASPSAPASIYALLKGEQLYTEAFDKLHQNIAFAQYLIAPLDGFNAIDNFPVYTSVDPNLYRHLLHNGIVISSFPYPLPSSPLLNRIVISALHEESDISQLSETLIAQSRLKL
ncbi:8-amino-7-oxononanoate synthase [Sphingobacterium sp. DK4209]|uniref:8-amino-7-oxononanoate synthase n=1 Tax=Sphingobacterium zhuxiongii TaxID=2662364 RepID=A0A5Q0QJ60_9SPHI|nr:MULTISPECIES: pyridoxal phosphate-dependent aminotransferase family protein [unclassified Sphingobacterium]MVZ65927.1 8-amino-7-oxononanoate synthase [Sphingobacterium sp. DK4209]QGA28062.1 8-amino-7-oxononanoate synthase [Sphingobacterium sp. dk4302]